MCEKEKKNVTAIAGLNLTVYEGQITALLGHNGAGKSTLIACLTGLTPCTSGEASVYDLNVNNSSDVDRIRKTTGEEGGGALCELIIILFIGNRDLSSARYFV